MLVLQEETAPEETAEEAPVKEKKEKKKVAFDAEDSATVDDIDLESFGKKKKKKKREGLEDLNDVKEALPEADDDDIDLENFGKKKKGGKKGRRKNLDDLDDGAEDKENEDENADPWKDSDRDYQYDELLQRVFTIMRDKNPEMVSGKQKKFVMRPPQVMRVGSKKTAFANFVEIAKMLHRQPKHLLQFLFAELGTSGAIDGSNQLIIKGSYQTSRKTLVTLFTCRTFPAEAHRERVETLHQGVRDLPHLQVPGHHPHQGDQAVLPPVHDLPQHLLGANHQNWLPGEDFIVQAGLESPS